MEPPTLKSIAEKMPEWLKSVFCINEMYNIKLESSKTREELCQELLTSRYEKAVHDDDIPKGWQMLAGLTGKILDDGTELALIEICHRDKMAKEKEDWQKYRSGQPFYVKQIT